MAGPWFMVQKGFMVQKSGPRIDTHLAGNVDSSDSSDGACRAPATRSGSDVWALTPGTETSLDGFEEMSRIWISDGKHDCRGRVDVRVRLVRND